ncbi:MAG: hypothetical protein FD141_211 [Fusobacteria bacterium]|nr:MAG: hypothetical protein FD141_211 [Fusobacteriota bacterium]KAF0229125.1 MAG: hypothetical protein FD182_1381 [Fusobacteriota bacterium]
MAWSKIRQQLDNFLYPGLKGILSYSATGYRYAPDKSGMNYITINKKNIFNINDATTKIKWYQTEQEIKNDKNILLPISDKEIEAIRVETKGTVPEDRLIIMARNKKIVVYAKELLIAQSALTKSDFQVIANIFLSTSIENSLESSDILINVLALVDKRVGKKRLLKMSEKIKLKHPVVQYFYNLRCSL